MNEARKREQEIMDEYGDKCVNQNRAYNSKEYNKEYKKQYHIDNADKINDRYIVSITPI